MPIIPGQWRGHFCVTYRDKGIDMYVLSVDLQVYTIRGLLALSDRPAQMMPRGRTSGLILAAADQTQASKECLSPDTQRQLRGSD